jgi:hypothetical protein
LEGVGALEGLGALEGVASAGRGGFAGPRVAGASEEEAGVVEGVSSPCSPKAGLHTIGIDGHTAPSKR